VALPSNPSSGCALNALPLATWCSQYVIHFDFGDRNLEFLIAFTALKDYQGRFEEAIFLLESSTQLIHKLLVVLLIVLWLLTLISLFGHHVYLELATHFRLQYALAASVLVALLIVLHSWKLLPFALGCALINWAYVLPYYSTPRRHESTTSPLRLMLINMERANRNYAAVTKAVVDTNADIIVLQEFTLAWQDHIEGLSAEYPYYEPIPRSDGGGMALFSRYPLTGVEVLTLDASTHVAVLARANVNGTVVSILALHPPAPVRSDKFVNRNRQFNEAAALLRSISRPKVLIGDLNTTMWSPYFRELIKDSGLRDVRLGFGLKPSWPMPLPALLQIAIDHCLVSDDIEVVAVRTGGSTGSDHRPVMFDVRLAESN
jgi:endonuclease/exonuclease/phosphatase (EEP) superfamily protein YafD